MAGQVWVEDDSIAKALAGLGEAFSPKMALAAVQARSEIALREEQRRKLQSQQQATDEAIAAETARQNALPSPTAPSVPIAGMPGAFDASIPLEGPPSPATPQEQANVSAEFDRVRRKQLADYALGARYATSMADVAGAAPKLAGQAQVAEYGIPTTAAEQAKLQTQLKGEIPQTEKAVGNWAEVDAQGNVVPGSGGMLDAAGHDVNTGRPPAPRTPGGRVMKAGEAKVGGAFESEGDRLAAVYRLARKATTQGLGPEEEAQLKFLAPVVFPWASDVQKNAQGQFVLISKQKQEPPQLLGDALTKLQPTGTGGAPAATDGAAFTQGAAPYQQTPGVTPIADAAQAMPGGGIAGPGFKVSAPFGPSEASNEALRKETSSATLASNAMNEFYKKFGYSGRDATTGAPGQFADPKAVVKTVPGFMSAVASEQGGTSILGQRAANWLDPKAQEYNALSYRFVEPVIRLASGAAISPREYSQYFSMFIPNANDSPTTAAQKLDSMKDWVNAVSGASTARGALDRMAAMATNPQTRQAVEQMRVKANSAGTLDKPFAEIDTAAPATTAAPAAAQAAPAARPLPKVGDTVNGRRYLGGDPRKPESWQ